MLSTKLEVIYSYHGALEKSTVLVPLCREVPAKGRPLAPVTQEADKVLGHLWEIRYLQRVSRKAETGSRKATRSGQVGGSPPPGSSSYDAGDGGVKEGPKDALCLSPQTPTSLPPESGQAPVSAPAIKLGPGDPSVSVIREHVVGGGGAGPGPDTVPSKRYFNASGLLPP